MLLVAAELTSGTEDGVDAADVPERSLQDASGILARSIVSNDSAKRRVADWLLVRLTAPCEMLVMTQPQPEEQVVFTYIRLK